MITQARGPTRLASEDVIISAPMSYAGSAQRIMRVRRRVRGGWKLVAITVLAIVLVFFVWAAVTGWYLLWGLLLVPYRLMRRGARKRKVEALRHRELMGTIQGSAAASAAATVTAMIGTQSAASRAQRPDELIDDGARERAVEELREHMLAGRLTTDEFEGRVASAQAARTRADLDAVRSNLPSSGPVELT